MPPTLWDSREAKVEGGGVFGEGGGHGDGAEGGASAHAGGLGGAHADGVMGHVAADDAEGGDEFADLAAVLSREGDVGGGEGGAGADAEGRTGLGDEDIALRRGGAEGRDGAIGCGTEDDASADFEGATVADLAGNAGFLEVAWRKRGDEGGGSR